MSTSTAPLLSPRQVDRLWRISIGCPPVVNDTDEAILRRRGLVAGDPDSPTLTDLGRDALAGELS